jgi:hypothetical protein
MYKIITEIEYPHFFSKGQLDYSKFNLDSFQRENIPLNSVKNEEGHFLITLVLKSFLNQVKNFSIVAPKIEKIIHDISLIDENHLILEDIKHLAFSLQNIDIAIDFISFLKDKLQINLSKPLGYSALYLKNIGKTPLMVVDNPKLIQFLLDCEVDLNVTTRCLEVYQDNSQTIDSLHSKGSIWQGQINYFSKVDNKNAYELAIYEKKKVKIRLLKNVKKDINELERIAFDELIQEKRIFRKLQLFVEAIRFDNQYVLSRLDDYRLKDVIHYDGGNMGKNVLSHAIEQNNMSYIQKLMQKPIFLKKNKFSNAYPITYLHYAIAYNKDYLGTFFYEQEFFTESMEEIIQYVKKYHHRGLLDNLHDSYKYSFELKDIILSLSWECLESSLEEKMYSQEEIKNTFKQLSLALMGNKTLDNEFVVYSSLFNKSILSLLNQLPKEDSDILFKEFTTMLNSKYERLRIEYWNNAYYFSNKKQLFNLYIAIKSVLPEYKQDFFDVAKYLEPEHAMLVKSEKRDLEQLLMKETKDKEKPKRVKI